MNSALDLSFSCLSSRFFCETEHTFPQSCRFSFAFNTSSCVRHPLRPRYLTAAFSWSACTVQRLQAFFSFLPSSRRLNAELPNEYVDAKNVSVKYYIVLSWDSCADERLPGLFAERRSRFPHRLARVRPRDLLFYRRRDCEFIRDLR